MQLLISYLKQYKRLLFLALVLAAINQIFSLLDPQIFRLIVDRYASQAAYIGRGEFIRGVGLLLLASVGVAMVSRIAKNFQDYCVNVITQRLGAKLYADSIAHALALPYAVFEDQRSGELLKKLEKARTDSQGLIAGLVNVVFLSLVGIVFVISYAFIVHWLIGLIYALVIPTLGLVIYLVSRKIKTAQKEIVLESAAMAGSTTETIRNVELVKSLGLEEQEVSRLNRVNDRILELELKKVRLVRMLSFVQGTLINALRSALLLLMLWLIFNKSMTLGQFFSLLFYSFFVFGPLGDLGAVATQYQEAQASNGELGKILAMQKEEKLSDAVKLDHIKSITYDGVSFVYNASTKGALHNLSFEIKAGQTVAFVGPSGSGKSTLIKILVGLYKPTAGRVLFNGIGASKADLEHLRKRIGFVAQETQLFAGTIRENLLFVNPQARDEECLEALQLSSAMDILRRGDQGLDTKIGEGGIKISGGERQRLAIARALLRDPEIIIFDEATSSLDSITELAVTETIRSIANFKPQLVTVLVAHRLSTVAHADRIYVLEKGEIVEKGKHVDLVAKGGLYSAMWRQQTAGEERPLYAEASVG